MAAMSPPDPSPPAEAEARRSKVNEVWSSEAARDTQLLGQYWLAHPQVREHVNRLASGRPDQDAYGRLAELLAARGWALPIPRALSLGCGFGGLERDLVSRGLVWQFEAFDLAEGAIAEARRLAGEAGFSHRIAYRVADLEQVAFAPGSFDAVFAHSSVHHVERLEPLLAAVMRALRPGGLFHLHEFVGPTRFQWTDAQLGLGNALLDGLPPRLRRLPGGQPKPPLIRPTIADMIAADPSEAIRSADILPLVRARFDVVEERALGGALLHNVLGDIAQNFDPASPEDSAALAGLFAAEDAAMAAGTIGTDFATVTAFARRPPLWRRLLSYSPIPRSSASSRARQAGRDSTSSA